MVPWLLLLPLPLPVLAGLDKTFGVPPGLISKYVPSRAGTWTCLDGSKEIPWAFVNDDSCDCPDGSDEPGTSACPDNIFYCQNKGHIGASIPSSRVNDGLCEPQCCDGSDEPAGVCKNVCKEVGEVYRKKRGEERKIRKTGAKIRASYIAFAQKEEKRLEALVQTTADEIAVQEKEVARLKDITDRAESLSQASLEHKQRSPLYISLIEHSRALRSLRREHARHLERERALGDILDALRTGYNPNYQDMAVLEAVRGWEELAGLSHVGEAGKDTVTDEEAGIEPDAENKDERKTDSEQLEEGMWTAERLENELDSLLKADYVSLLLEHEEHVQSPVEGSLLFDLTAYLPDSIIPHYEEFKDTLVSWLRTIGIIRGDSDSSGDNSRARQALSDAENELERIKHDKTKAEEDLQGIFDAEGFGVEGEWKKLDGTCLQQDTGDYTYEVCLFGEAKQIPKLGGSTFSLGRFESWNPSPDVQPGEPEFYQKQIYQHGARCWNGPERNVVLLLSCATENALLSVVELEKCEYQFTGTTPALCLPLDAQTGDNKQSREEL